MCPRGLDGNDTTEIVSMFMSSEVVHVISHTRAELCAEFVERETLGFALPFEVRIRLKSITLAVWMGFDVQVSCCRLSHIHKHKERL